MIRHATPSDIPALIEMGRRFFEESGFSAETSFDVASIEKTLVHLLESPDVLFSSRSAMARLSAGQDC